MQSPQVKAHNDIKSIYGVDIPQNSGTIKQVVGIAQSQFGGDVAVAVRSPSVRQLVMLYSEATGQHMPLSASTPYGGSLVESGGGLYQQASFQDGQAHMYSSSLPTLGGIGGTTYPTQPGPNASGGGGMAMPVININGPGDHAAVHRGWVHDSQAGQLRPDPIRSKPPGSRANGGLQKVTPLRAREGIISITCERPARFKGHASVSFASAQS